jgi:L-ribulose-5-phosphate 3-epimerase
MKNAAAGFGVNTYSYIFGGSAADTVARLADQGYGGVELMFFPGHLRPAELDPSRLRGLCQLCEQRLRLVAVNMPNLDVNVAGAALQATGSD